MNEPEGKQGHRVFALITVMAKWHASVQFVIFEKMSQPSEWRAMHVGKTAVHVARPKVIANVLEEIACAR